jgi:hypothetical protein
MISEVEKMYKDEFTSEELKYIVSFKYSGKTADEWLKEMDEAEGLDEDGNPAWQTPYANATYAIATAQLNLQIKKECLDEMTTGASQRPSNDYIVGDILFNKLSYKEKIPPKYFKCSSVDKEWGVVGYRYKIYDDTLGIAYVRKANFFEKIIYKLFYEFRSNQ